MNEDGIVMNRGNMIDRLVWLVVVGTLLAVYVPVLHCWHCVRSLFRWGKAVQEITHVVRRP